MLSTHDDDAAWRVASLELLQHVGTTRDAEAVSTAMLTSPKVWVSMSCFAAAVWRPLERLRSQTSQSSVVRGRAALFLSDFGLETPGSDSSVELLKQPWGSPLLSVSASPTAQAACAAESTCGCST